MRRALVLIFVSLFLFGASAVAATTPNCAQHPTCQLYNSLPPAQKNGLAKAGRELGNERDLAKLYATARLKGSRSFYPAGEKLSLVIDNEGLDRKLYVTDHTITGKTAFGVIGGKNIRVFAPDHNEFVVAITTMSRIPNVAYGHPWPPQAPTPAPASPSIPSQKPKAVSTQADLASAQAVKSRFEIDEWNGCYETIEPMDDPYKKTNPNPKKRR